MKIVAGNWKMNLSLEQALELARSVVIYDGVEVILFPPCIYALKVKETVAQGVHVGVQNMFYEDKGAYTGEISAYMLNSSGIEYVLIGHSERRKYFGETDEDVNRKLRKALEYGLKAIVCVGETLEQREKGEAFSVVRKQVETAFEGIDDLERIYIAYEPVWAIGTGVNATPEQAQEMHEYIKSIVNVPVLYGGSVKPENAKELLSMKDVDGVLVGGASLKAQSFNEIVRIASSLSL